VKGEAPDSTAEAAKARPGCVSEAAGHGYVSRWACGQVDPICVLRDIVLDGGFWMSGTGGVVAVTSLALEARIALGPECR